MIDLRTRKRPMSAGAKVWTVRSLARSVSRTLGLALAAWLAGALAAHAATPLPPPPAMDSKPERAQPAQTPRPRTVIRAPEPAPPPRPAASAPAAAADNDKPVPITEAEAGEELPSARKAEREAKIEQIPRGAGVTEIVVTPAFSTHSYTIINREGARRAPQENQSSLSTPRFLRFDF